MDNAAKNSILKIMQKEFARRCLIKYFSEKGYDNFLVNPYPPTILDLEDDRFADMIEVKYYLEDINMKDNMIKLGWNIFVLGNKRIFLGYTTHQRLNEVENGRNDSNKHHDGPINIKKIIETIVEILGNSSKLKDIDHEQGYGDLTKLPTSVRPYKPVPDIRRRV